MPAMPRFWLCGLVFYLLVALVSSSRAAVSPSPSPSPGCMATAPLFLLQGPLPFCGGKVGSPTCCTLDDDANLHRAFLDEIIKSHDDPQCLSTLKAMICAVCLPSAPAAEPFINNTTASTNNESPPPPLRCAAAASVSIHDLTPPGTDEPPTPEWMVADDSKAPTIPKWLIALLSVLGTTLLGSVITYKIHKARLECGNNIQCCSNIHCCLC